MFSSYIFLLKVTGGAHPPPAGHTQTAGQSPTAGGRRQSLTDEGRLTHPIPVLFLDNLVKFLLLLLLLLYWVRATPGRPFMSSKFSRAAEMSAISDQGPTTYWNRLSIEVHGDPTAQQQKTPQQPMLSI